MDDAINGVETAADAAIANLPGYILQKANPSLYDLFQNGLLRAQESLRQHFEGPTAANKWVTEILGDLVIGTCDTCMNGSQAGKGLIPAIEETAETVKSLLTDLVMENTRPNRANLEKVAALGIAITLQL